MAATEHTSTTTHPTAADALPPSTGRGPNGKGRRAWRRYLVRAAGLLLAAVLSAAVWLTSPWGEHTLGLLVQRVANSALTSQGLTLRMGGLGGIWQGRLRVWDVSLSDAKGTWLHLPWVRLHLGALPLLPTDGVRTLLIRELEIEDAEFLRAPQLPPSAPAPAASPAPIRLLPEGLAIRMHRLLLNDLQIGEGDDAMHIFAYLHGTVGASTANLRAALDLRRFEAEGRIPERPKDLPDDMTLSLRQWREKNGQNTPAQAERQTPTATQAQTPSQAATPTNTSPAARNTPTASTPTAATAATDRQTASAPPPRPLNTATQVSLDWDGNYADLRIQASDAVLLHRVFPGLDRIWSRSRVQLSAAQWPPDAAHPLQARWVSRFGVSGAVLGEKVRASLLSGQIYWDGARLVLRDVDITVPLQEPRVILRGSGGIDPEHGPGAAFRVRLDNLRALANTLGFKDITIGGSLRANMDVSRGGRHAAWWTRILPEPVAFTTHPLPGFSVDAGGAAATAEGNVAPAFPSPKGKAGTPSAPQPREEAVAGARASQSPTALHMDFNLQSPSLELSGGVIDNISVRLQASSVDVQTAPQGTASRQRTRLQPPPSPPQATSPRPAASPDRDSADFTGKGLPRALVGTLDAAVGSLMGLGGASLHTDWLAAGLPGEADIFQAQLDKLTMALPGVALNGEMGLAYALPIRRLWPWLDGNIALKVDNWQALSRLISSPIRGEGVGLRLQLESRLDEQQQARQYLRADFDAAHMVTPTFTVRDVHGNAVSEHVHALADAMSLTIEPQREGSTSPEPSPPASMSLLNARVSMGSGAGGPVNWNKGDCNVSVAGENASFNASLRGTLEAALTGTFNFRQRLLKLQRMEMSQAVSPSGDAAGEQRVGLRLSRPTSISLHEGLHVDNLQLALLPEGSLRINARVPQGTAGADSMQGTLELHGMPLSLPQGFAAAYAAPEGPPPAWLAHFPQGVLSCQVRLGGKLSAPTGTLGISLTGLRSSALPGMPPADVRLSGTLQKSGNHSILATQAAIYGLPGLSSTGTTPTASAPTVPTSASSPSTHVVSQSAPAPRGTNDSAVTATARIPLRFAENGVPTLASDAPLTASAAWQGRLEPLWKLAPLPGRTLSGAGSALARVTGTANAPRITVHASVQNVYFEDKINGIVMQDINADARYDTMAGSSLRASASDGRGGTLRLEGRLGERPAPSAATTPSPVAASPKASKRPSPKRATPPPTGLWLAARGELHNLRPLRRDDLAIQLSGDLGVNGPLTAPLISGVIRLDQGAFQLLRGFTPSVRGLENVEQGSCPHCAAQTHAHGVPTPTDKQPHAKTPAGTAPVAKAPAAGPTLDMTINAPGKFFIRGKGLDSEWAAHLQITGPVAAPRLLGKLTPMRGTLELIGREFRFDEGSISFDGSSPPNPALDLTLAFKNAQITALVQVRGTGQRPTLDLTSEPALPRDEVMAQVLFGKNMASLSRFETIQAATSAAQLVGLGPAALDVFGTARQVLGLEVLRLGSGRQQNTASVGGAGKSALSAPGASSPSSSETQETVLEAGKYVTDNIYVGLEQGLRPQDGTGVRVEVELTPHISLSGRTSQQNSGVGLDWKMDY